MSYLYTQWLETCRHAGIPAISTDTAARLMAVLHEYGNNEAFTYNKKFLADMEYIKKRFHLYGTGIVPIEFSSLLKDYIKELQDYQQAHEKDACDETRRIAPDWAPALLKERYNIKFIG